MADQYVGYDLFELLTNNNVCLRANGFLRMEQSNGRDVFNASAAVQPMSANRFGRPRRTPRWRRYEGVAEARPFPPAARSKLAEVMDYAIGYWKALCVYLDHGQVE